jgi:hypothetical protein
MAEIDPNFLALPGTSPSPIQTFFFWKAFIFVVSYVPLSIENNRWAGEIARISPPNTL